MRTLLQALYTYASENRVVYPQVDKLQIKESNQMAERSRQEVMSLLSEKGQAEFENYIAEEELIQGLDLEAIFRAGLAIGLELSRL